jgi:signal transduction histidine kinase
MVSFLGARFLAFLPLVALGLAILVGGLAYWAARQLSRGFSRPIADLVAWTRLIGHGDSLPSPGPADRRGVEEFAQLRDALRAMANELEEGRAQAIQTAKLRSWTEMARRVAHEIKNPLTPMRLAAGAVARLEDRVAREAGTVLLEEIRRLDELARTFAQFGRMPEGPPSQVDLCELLLGLIRQHEGAGAGLRLTTEGEIPLILGHPDALERSFRNLLLNALEAVGAEGRVEVRLWRKGEAVLTEIRDWGPGIPEGNLDRIWEPDFTTRSRGTGLGLPMVRQTIAAHQGRVQAGNHPEGGAVFLVALPITRPDDSRWTS